MIKSLLCTTVALSLSACVAELGDPDDPELAEVEQSLSAVSMPFSSGYGVGDFTTKPATITAASNGLLGWRGHYETGLFGIRYYAPAIRTSSEHGDDDGGATWLKWKAFTVPSNGYYDLVGTLKASGYTRVYADGNFLSTWDAMADVWIEVKVWSNTGLVKHAILECGDDATRSESRTKSFSKSFNLGDGAGFYAYASGTYWVEIIAYTQTITANEGEASAALSDYGLTATSTANALTIQPGY